jgi:hypothetical protein
VVALGFVDGLLVGLAGVLLGLFAGYVVGLFVMNKHHAKYESLERQHESLRQRFDETVEAEREFSCKLKQQFRECRERAEAAEKLAVEREKDCKALNKLIKSIRKGWSVWRDRVHQKQDEFLEEQARLIRELDEAEGRLLQAKQEACLFQSQLGIAVERIRRLVSTDNVSVN